MTKSVRHSAALFLIAVLILGFPVFKVYAAAALDNLEDVEAFFDGLFAVQQWQYHVPGISVAVIQDGQAIFAKGYGYSDLENKTPVDPYTTLHRPGSNGKLLVWTAVLQLVEQGKLDLDRDINDYLDFSIPNKLHNGKETEPITLHHLLTHTAGFEEVITGVFVLDPEEMQPLGAYLQSNLPGRVFAPGTTAAYSNYGTSLAAYIVERAANQPFSTYVEEHIFQPLGMTRSTFQQPLPPALAKDMSKGYIYQNGKYTAGDFEYVQSYPAGGLTCSTMDMAKLIIAHLQLGAYGDERILKEETALLMQGQQFANHPEIPGMAYGFIENSVNGYRVLEHGGDTGLFHTGLYLIPQEQIGVYLSYNALGSAPARWYVFQAFMDRYFPEETPSQVVPRPITPGTEGNYVGYFHSTRSNFTMLEAWIRLAQTLTVGVDEDGYLLLSAGGTTARYGEIAPGLFQEVDDSGKIAVKYQDGRLVEIYPSGPASFVRTAWNESLPFVSGLLICAFIFMLITLIGWIVQLFKKKRPAPRRSFGLPKTVGVLFSLFFFTLIILFIGTVTDFHPDLGAPKMFVQTPPALGTIITFAKVLSVLSGLMLISLISAWVKHKGTIWQRIHYTIFTGLGAGVVWLLWNFNFLK